MNFCRTALRRAAAGGVLALCLLVAPAMRAAWEGVSWDEWRKVSSWKRPDRVSAQTGRSDLVPLLGETPPGITNALSWAFQRQALGEIIGGILGAPRPMPVPGVEVRELGVEELSDHVRRHLLIRSEAEDWIPAYLLVPRAPGPPRRAAMICLHQTVAQGKEEPCGMRGSPEMAFALELVRRGYVCLAPDAIGFGERIAPGRQPYDDSIAFYRRHPGWSFMGKMIWDVSRLVDYLQTLPGVDPERLGCIGHSHGAYGTLFATAFEPRLRAAVASCGFTTFRADPHPERWSHLTALIPQLGDYLPKTQDIPFDWHHVLALAAPRPLYVWYTTADAIFPNTGNLDGLLRDVQGVYRLHEAADQLAWRSAEAPHVFPRAEREAAYAWLDRALAPAPVRVPAKTSSAFYPARLVERARENAAKHAWAAGIRDSLVAAAQPWVTRSDEELWALMFGNTLKRAWQVWSDGHCPSCLKPVPMYEWQPEALAHPWKLRCPKCLEWFPKNDFGRYYRSGLDERGVFNPARADRSLLFNVEHPDPADPRHRFGVDDGEGYVSEGRRWRFINAYLIFGQWKQAIVEGIRHLSGAYVATGDLRYAHKAGVMLDRVADLYPTFDFGREGVMYEGPPRAGYVSTWHDACVEVYELALAYDAVFDGLARDPGLVEFLRAKAERLGLPNPKASFADIQRNIEDRLLRDTLANRPKIESNYPMTDRTVLTLEAVLDWPRNRDAVLARLDGILETSTAVDGLTGEKGIAGYSLIAPRDLAELLGRFMRSDPAFLSDTLRRHPGLHAMYRFHIDTWCLGRFYPRTGDTGGFGSENPQYAAVAFTRNPGIQPSAFAFLKELAQATGDADFIRVLAHANGGGTDGLPWDLFAEDPEAFQAGVRTLLEREGAAWKQSSVLLNQWCLAVLRSGVGPQSRAVWLDFDSGERHGHADALTLGLFARGRDLLPDFGYPPVQYGGWGSPRAKWYTSTAAHNTVALDGRDSRSGRGASTLWLAGGAFQAVRAEAAGLVEARQFERTVALVDVAPDTFYVVDLFRVEGGRAHTRTFHGPMAQLEMDGIELSEDGELPVDGVMRHHRRDPRPRGPWRARWRLEGAPALPEVGGAMEFRLTDLTRGARAGRAESWVSMNSFVGTEEAWIPSVLSQRSAQAAPLASTFVAVLEAGSPERGAKAIHRLEVRGAAPASEGVEEVGLAVELLDGSVDLLLARNVPDRTRPPSGAVSVRHRDLVLEAEAELAWVRFGPSGAPLRMALGRGMRGEAAGLEVRARPGGGTLEVEISGAETVRVHGGTEALDTVMLQGRRLRQTPQTSE